jgi:hypothetical protein
VKPPPVGPDGRSRQFEAVSSDPGGAAVTVVVDADDQFAPVHPNPPESRTDTAKSRRVTRAALLGALRSGSLEQVCGAPAGPTCQAINIVPPTS